MRLGLGLGLGRNRRQGIAGDLYPDARIAFDPVNSWYKIGSFGTSDLAEFLARPEVHFSSDPTANISASGYLPDAADRLYVEFVNPGTDFTMMVEAMTTTPGADSLTHMFAALRGYDPGANFQGMGLGTSGNEAQPVMITGRLGSTGNGRISNNQIDFFSTDPAGGPYRGAVTISATTFAGWYGGAKTADFGADTTLADANITRLYLGWGGICQLAGVETDEEPSLNHVRIVTVQTSFDEDAAEAWTAISEPEAITLINAMDESPDETRQQLINDYIEGLKTAGIWAKLDLLYVIAAHHEQAARLNWVAPASFAATNVGAGPTFEVDRGITGNGSSTAWSTGYTPATHADQYAQDSASLWVWCLTNVAENAADFGAAVTHNAFVRTRSAGDAISHTVNGATTSTVASATSIGMTGISRADGTNQRAWKNGAASGAAAAGASTGLPAAAFRIGGRGNDLWSTKQIAMAAAGAALSTDEVADFYTLTQAYLASVGAA